MFEHCGRTDGQTQEHGYTISSLCEPEVSGELIKFTSIFTAYHRF